MRSARAGTSRCPRAALAVLTTAVVLLCGGLPTVASTAEKATDPQASGFTPKLTAPIGIAHSFATEPAVGVPVELTLTITGEAAIVQAVLMLGSEDSLVVTAPLGDVPLGTISPGQAAAVTVTLVPLVGGTQYLDVAVQGQIRGELQTRSIAVPIRVPETGIRKSEATDTGNKTESVRSFQAVETVR